MPGHAWYYIPNCCCFCREETEEGWKIQWDAVLPLPSKEKRERNRQQQQRRRERALTAPAAAPGRSSFSLVRAFSLRRRSSTFNEAHQTVVPAVFSDTNNADQTGPIPEGGAGDIVPHYGTGYDFTPMHHLPLTGVELIDDMLHTAVIEEGEGGAAVTTAHDGAARAGRARRRSSMAVEMGRIRRMSNAMRTGNTGDLEGVVAAAHGLERSNSLSFSNAAHAARAMVSWCT